MLLITLTLLCATLDPARNPAQLKDHYRTLADQGNSRAQAVLAELALDVGDAGAAFKWFSKAAEAGDATSQVRLADLYLGGRGTVRDAAQAAHWYAMAVSKTPEAQWKLGALFQQGDGVPENPEIAAAMFRRAADQGYADAQNSLAALYIAGIGLKQDSREAVKWFRKAAEQDCADAQVNLATLYFNGVGVKRDLELAREWALKAKLHRSKEANQLLAEIEKARAETRALSNE